MAEHEHGESMIENDETKLETARKEIEEILTLTSDRQTLKDRIVELLREKNIEHNGVIVQVDTDHPHTATTYEVGIEVLNVGAVGDEKTYKLVWFYAPERRGGDDEKAD